jgi:hypothetical protein
VVMRTYGRSARNGKSVRGEHDILMDGSDVTWWPLYGSDVRLASIMSEWRV